MFLNLADFKDKMKGKKVNVIGLGVSNIPLIRMLVDFGAVVVGRDKNEGIKKDLPIEYILGEGYLDNIEGDYIFKSPGIRYDLPPFVEFVEKGGILTSEMEVFFDICPCKIIGVTGSDGKTTTTTLISEMLKDKGYTVHIGGNIGKPLLFDVPVMNKTDICVVELSSFQLMTMKKSPDISVITNITPNHLDVHKSMDEYIEAKENIVKFQNSSGKAVLNFDNEITNKISTKVKSRVSFFSLDKKLDGGVYYDNSFIYDGDKKLIDISDIKIPGMHNVANYMTAYCAVKDLIDVENFVNVAVNFGGVNHRIEFVNEIDGVKYYNDSIASSPTRTIACLNAFYEKGKKITMIAGGYDKKIPFDELGKEIVKKAKKLYLVGDTAELIKEAVLNADKNFPVIIKDNLKETVDLIKKEAVSGDIVVLTPACASFDKYKNFEERGNLFKECVNNG